MPPSPAGTGLAVRALDQVEQPQAQGAQEERDAGDGGRAAADVRHGQEGWVRLTSMLVVRHGSLLLWWPPEWQPFG
jgi:hypothetical protein